MRGQGASCDNKPYIRTGLCIHLSQHCRCYVSVWLTFPLPLGKNACNRTAAVLAIFITLFQPVFSQSKGRIRRNLVGYLSWFTQAASIRQVFSSCSPLSRIEVASKFAQFFN